MKMLEETIEFSGHPAIRALHRTTLEITRENHLTENGDCIIGVRASKACNQIDVDFRKKLMTTSRIKIYIEVHNRIFSIKAFGSPHLTLTDGKEIVIRKSAFSSPRTLAVGSDSAAVDLPRIMAEELRDPACRGKLRMIIQ